MAGTMIINKQLFGRLRTAFTRYGMQILADPNITINFFPTEFEEYLEVFLTSPKFQGMRLTERQNSIWSFLRADPSVTNEDLNRVSRIATRAEAVEII